MTWAPHALLVLVTAAALVVMLGSWGVPAPAMGPPCMDEEMREHVRAIVLSGLEAGLKEQTAQLYINRLKDREKHPDRIVAGMRNAIWSYTRSRIEVKRWEPPPC